MQSNVSTCPAGFVHSAIGASVDIEMHNPELPLFDVPHFARRTVW